MSERSKSPEFSSRADYDSLVDRLELFLENTEPEIYLDPVDLPLGFVHPPRKVGSYRTARISHDQGNTGLQVTDSVAYGVSQPEVQSSLYIYGYYVTDRGSFNEGVNLWGTRVLPELLDPEDVKHILDCIDGKIPVRSDAFDKFKFPYGAK